MDYLIIILINTLLMFHTPPTTGIGSFIQGVCVGVGYMFIKHLILEKEQWER
jgi:hypothetical protein